MLVAKLIPSHTPPKKPFENYVNYAGSKTIEATITPNIAFENYVNYAGSKTSKTIKKYA